MPLRDRFSGNSDLYSFLKNVLLKDYLGVYTYTINNISTIIPAIYIVKDRDRDPPNEWGRSGIECLILPPTFKPRSYLSGNGVISIYRFRLIQHDRSKRLSDSIPNPNPILPDIPSVSEWIIQQLMIAIQESHLESNADREEQATYSISKTTV